MTIIGIDHVQLAMPHGGEEEARRFWVEVMGLDELPKPAHLAINGGCWFAAAGLRAMVWRSTAAMACSSRSTCHVSLPGNTAISSMAFDTSMPTKYSGVVMYGSPVPGLAECGLLRPWQLFGLLKKDGRDDPSSPAGFFALGLGRSVTPRPLLCTIS